WSEGHGTTRWARDPDADSTRRAIGQIDAMSSDLSTGQEDKRERRTYAPADSSDGRFDRRIRSGTRRVPPVGLRKPGRGHQAVESRLGVWRGCPPDGSGHVRGDGRALADVQERVRAADERDPQGRVFEDPATCRLA